MRSSKLLVCSAALLALVFVSAAQASDDAVVAEPAAPAEAPDEALAPDPDAATEAAPEPAADVAEVAPDGAEVAPVGEMATATPEAAGEAVEAAAAPDPTALPEDAGDAAAAEVVHTPEPAPVLGQIGYDSEGRPGRIHVVVPGDTLWDISDAYLGTPWVWPSIWTDNREIENPHRIHPGDRIWITDSEMRLLSSAEAEAMLTGRPSTPEEFPADQPEPVEMESAAMPLDVALVPEEQRTRRVSVREWVGLVSAEELEAAASIVRPVAPRVLLAQLDEVYLGIGEGDVTIGDQFEIIRDDEKVFDPDTGHFLGHHVVNLGWLDVTEVYDETSLGVIRHSTEDILVGDRVLARRPEAVDIAIQPSPEEVEGKIVFFPRNRVVIGQLDFVYLNRGTLDGLETGSPLEVVRAGGMVKESVLGHDVEVPGRVVGKLLVVDARPETAVALVSETEIDLLVGDSFRGAGR
jgi:hypothetical protein